MTGGGRYTGRMQRGGRGGRVLHTANKAAYMQKRISSGIDDPPNDDDVSSGASCFLFVGSRAGP